MAQDTSTLSPRTGIVRYDWQMIAKFAFAHRKELITANIISIFATLAAVPVPLLMPMLVDEVLLNQPGFTIATINRLFPQLWHGPFLYIGSVLLLTLLLRILSIVFNVWQARKFTIISKDVVYRMRAQLLRHLQSISMAEYETLGSGKVITHLVTDLETVDHFIGTTVSRLLVASLSITGTAIVLLWMHWQLALFILFLNPIVIYFTVLLGKRVKELKKQENFAFEIFQQSLAETLNAIHQIRASNRERYYIQQLVDTADSVRKHATSFAWQSDTASRLSFLVFLFGFDIFRAIAMLMVVFSDLSIGQMLAVFGYLWFMMSPVQEILNIQYAFYSAKAALVRINEIVDLRQEPLYPHIKNPFRNVQTVAIELDNIHFAYGEGNDVLNGISLTIPPGEKVALVGASGGGKSTLVQVLIGLYPTTSGRVMYAGIPLQEIGLDRVREHVVTVLQHPILFNDTVRANLTMGRDHPDSALWKALEIAQLNDTVRNFDQGLDTVLGRNGMRLSGGQRQRVAVARMVLTDPKVVILDEATSALDSDTEHRLHQALNNFLKNRTTIIVAHRLSAVKQANRVYVFEDGRIIEQGAHQTLLEKNGLYAKLYGERQRFN